MYISNMKKNIKRIAYSETENPEAVEKLFCKKLENSGSTEPLSESMMSVLLALVLSDVSKVKEMLASSRKITGNIEILESRAKSIGLNLDEKTLIFFGLVSGTPGIAVSYAYYLAYAFKKAGKETMEFDDIMVDVFPEGLFTDASLTEHWQQQKIDLTKTKDSALADNLLDYPTASSSISLVKV